MSNIFGDFDFRLLNDPEFREDSVREELVVPLLAALGYSASPPYRIIRSRQLEHPFVVFGTIRKGISIIPDYLLERDGKYAWVLDAKGPSENIDSGKNVEQAYSYAMHRDIRVPLYGLCNGHKLVVFHVSQADPVIDVSLQEIASVWPQMLTILGCRSAWNNGLRPDFRPDFGLALEKAGLAQDQAGKKCFQIFLSLPIFFVGKVEDKLYCVNSLIGEVAALEEDSIFMLTFDFGDDLFPQFLAQLEPDLGAIVRDALSRQPFKLFFPPENLPSITVAGCIGDHVFTNENESYRPFVVERFL